MGLTLELDSVFAGYQESEVLKDVSLTADADSVTALLGRNGVGKTTTLRTVMGLLETSSGSITIGDEEITNCDPHEAHRRGISIVTEERDIFPELSVEENLKVPLLHSTERSWSLDELYDLFPTLEEIRDSEGQYLSGGEQQMLAIARALRSGPELLLLDEPSEGLAPQIVADVADTIERVSQTDTTVLLVEQNVHLALDLAEYGYFMDDGRIVYEGEASVLSDDEEAIETHLGVTEIG
jgi:branched-chain amino acid transport system ATP-binding protein